MQINSSPCYQGSEVVELPAAGFSPSAMQPLQTPRFAGTFFGAVPVRFQSSDMHRLQLQFTWLTRVELISLSNKREWIVTSVGVSARTQCGDFEMEFRCGINGIIGPLASGWVKRSNLRWKRKVGTQRLSHSNSIRSSLADLIKLIIKSVIT